MENIDKSSHKYLRLFVFALVIGGAWLFGGYMAGGNRAEAQTDLLLERRIGQIEQRFYMLESRLNRLEQAPSILPQSPSRSDADVELLRTQMQALSVQMEGLRMRIGDVECGVAKLDERTLTPAARDARRKAGADGTEPCRANPNAPVRLMARP
jgi:hypothetical protein